MRGEPVDLNDLLGKTVKAAFRETTNALIEIWKGKLVAYDNNFIKIQSYENTHLINRAHLITLKAYDSGSTGEGER
jgi:hypothetical protein